MIGIIGESQSDVDTIAVLLRRLCQKDDLEILPFGFEGCAQMLKAGAREVRNLCRRGCTSIVIAYDSDGADPVKRRQIVIDRIVSPSGVGCQCCIVVPTQEIEAWILADVGVLSHVTKPWAMTRIKKPPETVCHPKEVLERLSQVSKGQPKYSHAAHNAVVARHLDLSRVSTLCPSFRTLESFAISLP